MVSPAKTVRITSDEQGFHDRASKPFFPLSFAVMKRVVVVAVVDVEYSRCLDLRSPK